MKFSNLIAASFLIIIIHLLLILMAEPLLAQDEFNDPLITGLNREKPHASLKFDSERVLTLDGDWQFSYFTNEDDLPKGFYLNGFDASGWETLNLPSFVDLDADQVSIDTGKPSAIYLKEFEAPDVGKDQQLLLRFDGVTPAYHVWINGFMIGYNEGFGVPAEFNITQFVKAGVNKIAVKLYQNQNSENKEYSEKELLTGIYDNVSVILREGIHMKELVVESYLNDSLSEVLLRMNIFMASFLQDENKGRTIDVSILSPEYKVIFKTQRALDFQLSFRQELEINIDHRIQTPQLWSPEMPALFQVKVSITGSEDGRRETTRTNIGFREIVNLDSAIVLNHDTIPLKFADQSELAYDYTLDESVYLNFFKENGYNSIRIYDPLPDRMLDMFDKNGIMVWHVWPEDDLLSNSITVSPELRKSLLYQKAYLFGKDLNRACIIDR